MNGLSRWSESARTCSFVASEGKPLSVDHRSWTMSRMVRNCLTADGSPRVTFLSGIRRVAMPCYLLLALEKIFENLEMALRLGYILAPCIQAVSCQQKSIAGLVSRKTLFHVSRQCLHIL